MRCAREDDSMTHVNRDTRGGWRRLHRCLGLWLGAWFALVGLTGAVLVYEDEIDAWLNPRLLEERRDGAWLAPQAILERAQEEFPLSHVERLRPPAAPPAVYRLVIRLAPHLRVGSPRADVMFSPVTGELLGTRETEAIGLSRPYLVKTLYEFHRNVLLGGFGSNITGIAGMLLLGAATSGVIAALPRRASDWRRLLYVKLRTGFTRASFDIHRSSGVLLAILIVLSTLTGLSLVYPNYVRDIVGVFSPVASFPTVPWRQLDGAAWPSFAEIHDVVLEAYPDRHIVEIHIPTKPTAGYMFFLRGAGDVHRRGDTIVWVHPASGEILFERSNRNRSAGERFMHWLFPLHSGAAFGAPGKVAMCLSGVLPVLLVLTGTWLWSRKRVSERIERARRETVRAMAPAGRGERPAHANATRASAAATNLCVHAPTLGVDSTAETGSACRYYSERSNA